MKINRNFIILFFLIVNLNGFSQKVKHLPKCLEDPYVRIDLKNIHDNKCGETDAPWVTYSIQEPDFGQKFYVTGENGDSLNIFSGRRLDGYKIIDPVDRGLRGKSKLLIHFAADLADSSKIHKKCVVLFPSRSGLLDSIAKGIISNSDIPVFHTPYTTQPIGKLPIYYIFFVYKTENGRFLLGRNFKFQPDLPFSEQIIGWVPANLVYQYNSRVCFEPNYEKPDLAYRICNPTFTAKTFKSLNDLHRFESGDNSIKPNWVEDWKLYIERKENESFDQIKTKICVENDLNNIQSKCLQGHFFRFPLIKVIDQNWNTRLGVSARIECRDYPCPSVQKLLNNVNIFFIIDHTIEDFRASYVISQIEQNYRQFVKQFGVCFYPRLENSGYKISLGQTENTKSNYSTVVDFITSGFSPFNMQQPGDDCFDVLNSIVKNENFDPKQTNIVFLLTKTSPNALTDELAKKIGNNLAEKNCNLIVFNYSSGSNLNESLLRIFRWAQDKSNQILQREFYPLNRMEFRQNNSQFTLDNSIFFSKVSSISAGTNTANVIREFLYKSYVDLESYIASRVASICNTFQSPENSKQERELTTYDSALIATVCKDVHTVNITALFDGFSALKHYNNYDKDHSLWKNEILMTQDELIKLHGIIESILTGSINSSERSKLICKLWMDLFNAFVGEKLNEKNILTKTPVAILNEIIGSDVEYTIDDIKRFTLNEIYSDIYELKDEYPDYIDKLKLCKASLGEILSDTHFQFDLDENIIINGKKITPSGIKYYWIPISNLP